MIRVLIFDFDGLILDTETPAFVSTQAMYREYDHELTLELWKDALGRKSGEGLTPIIIWQIWLVTPLIFKPPKKNVRNINYSFVIKSYCDQGY